MLSRQSSARCGTFLALQLHECHTGQQGVLDLMRPLMPSCSMSRLQDGACSTGRDGVSSLHAAAQVVLTHEWIKEDARIGRRGYGAHLLLLDPEKLAVLTMHLVLSQLLFARSLFRTRHERNAWEEVHVAGQAKLIDVAYQLGKARITLLAVTVALPARQGTHHSCPERVLTHLRSRARPVRGC